MGTFVVIITTMMFYIFLMINYLLNLSTGSVIVPHKNPNYENERCDTMCLPGSFGIRRSQASLCEPNSDQCQEEANIEDMTNVMCQAWAHIFPFLDEDGVGKQIKQDNAKGSWLPCSVFCQTKTGTWYSPRKELDSYYLSAALPDGTLCHGEEYDYEDELLLDEEGKIIGKWESDDNENEALL